MNWVISLTKYTFGIFMLTLLFSTQTFADDIEIFESEEPVEPPNILFLMDVSGSMQWEVGSENIPVNSTDSRLSILKGALGDLLTDADMVDVNVGLMSFSGHGGSWLAHGPSYPVKPIDADALPILKSNSSFAHPGSTSLPSAVGITSRGYIQEISNTWNAENGTPIVDALFEAAKYMRGEDIHWGNKEPSEPQAAHPSTYGVNTNLIANGSISNTYQCNTDACGGTTGVSCNHLSSCATTPASTTTNTCSTPTCGDPGSCTKTSSTTLNCPSGATFCGTAVDATECTTTPNPGVNVECLLTEAECLAANPLLTSCSTDVITLVVTCIEGVPDTVTCPVDEYTCSTTTAAFETCTHEVCGSISSSGIDYISPITNECQNNAIILLSDGEPTVNNSSPLVETMVGTLSNNCSSTSTEMGRCGEELARFLAESDHSSQDGDQNVNLYTIGFALGASSPAETYLRTLASAGGGTFASADSTAGLIKAFKEAISGINKKARLFSSPTYTSNSESILAHGSYVYMPVFNRESGPHWSGNLKKFNIVDGRLVDKDDNSKNATSDSGALNNAKDEWAVGDIAHAVKDGGAANKLNPDARNLFTDNGNTGTAAARAPMSSVTNAQLGLSSTSTEKDALLNFIKGKNEDGSSRHHMGDIIHSKPVHVDIDGEEYIFVGTNEGYLHAFKASDGEEVFAYMPSELLKNIKRQKDNDPTDFHVYGVDGEITVWKGKLNTTDVKDTVMLLFGLRRGGKAYYALNVTNPSSPTLAWKITASGDFSQLGYSWSKPKIAKVKIDANAPKNVMIIGGGYVDDNGEVLKDGNGDPQTEADNSGTGSDVYIVDLANGTKLWKTPDATISYAVPGGVRTMDIDRNGLVDRLYFADVGGNIWRADLNFQTSTSDFKVYPFASLGGSASSKRKFFNEPDVAFFRHAGQYVMSIAIGSGDRPNALGTTTDDRFYTMFDTHPFKYNTNETPNKPTIIKDPDHLVSIDQAETTNFFTGSLKGWYLDFDAFSGAAGVSGEKVLSSAFTFENKVIFTSFGIGTASVDPNDACKTTSANQSHLYVLDLLKGKKVLNLDDTVGTDVYVGPLDDIPDAPQLYIPKTKNCTVDDCTIKTTITVGAAAPVEAPSVVKKLPKVYWIDKQRN